MDNPPVTEAELQAYVDERLPEKRRAEVDVWLAAHPEEAERIAAYQRIGAELRTQYDAVLDEPVPAVLKGARTPRRRRWGDLSRAALWLACGLGVGTIAGWQFNPSRSASAPAAEAGAVMARRAAVAHATYSPEVRHPVEVGAEQEAHLVAWLSKRLGTPVRAPDLDTVGYSLVGGRLLPGDNGPVAHFMYQCSRGTRITLYVRTEMAGNRETAFRYAREGNVGVFYWVDRKLGYALSSADISKEQLLDVANAVYRQLNP